MHVLPLAAPSAVLIALAATLVVLVSGPAPAAARATSPIGTPVAVGIADQKPDMFTDPRFVEFGIKRARLTVGWDALTSSWQVDELETWLQGAMDAGVEPLISFGHSRTARRSLPTPDRMKYEFERFRRYYPWVKTFAAWNEANHCGEPTCHRPKLVAAYYRMLRKVCETCKILPAELLDTPNMAGYARSIRRHLGFVPGIWGLHNYVEANRFTMKRLRELQRATRGSLLWLTETGGLVRRRNRSTTDIPEGARHAGEVTRYIFDHILPRNPRIRRVYIYHWNAGPANANWDSGLIARDGTRRTALDVLERVLELGQRPTGNFRSPAKPLRRPAAPG